MTEPKPVVTQADELLPCPFCGSSLAVTIARTRVDAETQWWGGECRDCGAQTCPSYSEMEAFEAWNTRAPSSPSKPVEHWSDCAVHNEPAYPAGECDCGGFSSPSVVTQDLVPVADKVVSHLSWIIFQCDEAMGIGSAYLSTDEDVEDALRMLTSIASDIHINATMAIEVISAAKDTTA